MKYISDTNFIIRYFLADNKEMFAETKMLSLKPKMILFSRE